MSVLVGTASWTDPTLIACGRFYPPQVNRAEARLRFYAQRFGIVEVDSSYYAMPSPAHAQSWAERTPAGFVMNVKAFRLFTRHATSPDALHADIRAALGPRRASRLYHDDVPQEIRDELWRRFREALAPLKRAGRLGLVHFQFPPWLRPDRDGREHVQGCVERMAGHTVSVEFRHRSWFDAAQRDATLAFERELGVVHTVVDAPQGCPHSVPAVWATTHPECALLRLHGRNARTWNLKGATASSDRFDYDYPDAELAELVASIRTKLPSRTLTHVIFNNNRDDQAQRNATTLMSIIAASSGAP